MQLRVMSFNVRVKTFIDVLNPWTRRRGQIAEQVRAFDPDLLATQELAAPQADDLRERLRDYDFFGAGRNDGKRRGEMCGVFVNAARLERIDGGHFWLSQTPDVPGSKLPWTIFPRIVTWLKLRSREPDGGEFTMFNTHFPVVPAGTRAEAAAILHRHIAVLASGLPCIVTGDFNDTPGSETHRLLTSSSDFPLMDTYRSVHPQERPNEATIHHFRGGERGGRIDWILAAPSFRCVDAAIDRTRGPRGYASDHFPVTAVLET